MKIYLDDMRETPFGWERCHKVEEVQKLLCDAMLGIGETITHMSLDHDLGASYLCMHCYYAGDKTCQDGCVCNCHTQPIPLVYPSGYDLVKWMAQHDMWPTNKPTVHSANPAGRINMQATIDRYWHPPGTENKL